VSDQLAGLRARPFFFGAWLVAYAAPHTIKQLDSPRFFSTVPAQCCTAVDTDDEFSTRRKKVV